MADESLNATLNDPARLAALGATLLLDSPSQPEFDRLTRLAKRLLNVPTALISLVSGERQYFKSCIGLSGWPAERRGTPIQYSFCQHVVHAGAPLAIADARTEPLVRDNPATSELDVVAYLGIPLHARCGQVLGTICAIDTEVREWSEDDIAAMRDLAEGVMTEIALTQEVRALQTAERELAEAADAKARLLANVSHELRTPMNGIMGILQLLSTDELTDGQRALLRTASSAGGELLRIVNDVLDFSKLEAGKLCLDPQPFVLAHLVEDVCRLLEGEARVALVASVDPSLPQTLRGDGGRLRQVLTNLVANALKFTEVGEVAVRAEAAGVGRVRFSVTDSGIGIAPDRLPHLFEPFEQAETTTARRYGGTGLGLTITRDLVELLGGRLQAQSVVGAGSTFSFTIPLAAVAPTRVEGRVLVADDNEVNRLVVQLMLAKRGLDVDVVGNGAQAVEAVRTGDYCVVLMDCEMPVTDGFAATARIRDAGASVPIVAMTGHVGEADRRRCLGAGMDDHLAKPIERAALDAVLERWLPAAR
jgi:signal transduction histidine kinase/CheY-like chemotaxis protein